jgi:hypothetical protein
MAMKTKVNVPPELANNAGYMTSVAKVEAYLRGLDVQPSIYTEKEPSAELRLYENSNGAPVLVIELIEPTNSCVRAYYLDFLSDPDILRINIGEMRREFLRGTSRQLQRRIRETVSQMAEDE